MAPSAAVVRVLTNRTVRELAHAGASRPSRRPWTEYAQRFARRLVDRLLAGFAFHDLAHYRRLVTQTASLVDYRGDLDSLVSELRRHDPQGLGVWYIARIAPGPSLTDVCRRVFRSRAGPPRAVARLLEQSLDGKPVCWFGQHGGFEALVAESLLTSAIVAALTAAATAAKQSVPDWTQTAYHLTRASQSLQTSVRAFRRVLGKMLAPAEEAVNLTYQSVNVARRALNRTDLLAVDDRLAAEVIQLMLASAKAACAAALDISTNRMPSLASGNSCSGGKLASLARTLDALLARIEASVRTDTWPADARDSVTAQAARVLMDLERALRPWAIQLITAPAAGTRVTSEDWCLAANELLEASAETLDGWAVLHEMCRAAPEESASSRGQRVPAVPEWARLLIPSIIGQLTPNALTDSLRRLGHSADDAVAGAVAIAAFRGGSLHLNRELWKLIRAASSSEAVRRFSFQLFWRLSSPCRERNQP